MQRNQKNTKIVNYTKRIEDNTYFFLQLSDKIKIVKTSPFQTVCFPVKYKAEVKKMVIGTMGVRFYENYEFPVCFTEDIKKLEEKDAEKFYKILYLKGGKGNFSINGITKKLSGSYLVCLNEKDVINPEQLKVLHVLMKKHLHN